MVPVRAIQRGREIKKYENLPAPELTKNFGFAQRNIRNFDYLLSKGHKISLIFVAAHFKLGLQRATEIILKSKLEIHHVLEVLKNIDWDDGKTICVIAKHMLEHEKDDDIRTIYDLTKAENPKMRTLCEKIIYEIDLQSTIMIVNSTMNTRPELWRWTEKSKGLGMGKKKDEKTHTQTTTILDDPLIDLNHLNTMALCQST